MNGARTQQAVSGLHCPRCGGRPCSECPVPGYGITCGICGHRWRPDNGDAEPGPIGFMRVWEDQSQPTVCQLDAVRLIALVVLGALLKVKLVLMIPDTAGGDGIVFMAWLAFLVLPAVAGYFTGRITSWAYLWVLLCPAITVLLVWNSGMMSEEWGDLGEALAVMGVTVDVVMAFFGVGIGHIARRQARRSAVIGGVSGRDEDAGAPHI